MRQRKEKKITVKGHVFILFHNLEMVGMKDRRSSCTLSCLIHCFFFVVFFNGYQYYCGCNPGN